MAHLAEMDAEAMTTGFFDDLDDCYGQCGTLLVSGTRRVVVAVPAKISRPLLGANWRLRGGLSICLITVVVIAFFLRQDVVSA
jgi:hypothetical protein